MNVVKIVTQDGVEIEGWTAIHIVRSIQNFPSAYHLEMSLKYPSPPNFVPADQTLVSGMPITIYIDDEVILTGYVGPHTSRLNAQDHAISVSGRSTCQDLIDCSAMLTDENGHYVSRLLLLSVLDIANRLSKPYGVTVTSKEKLPVIDLIDTNLGETVYDLIERMARYSGYLVYPTPDGNVVIAAVGAGGEMSGSINEGGIVESGEITWDMDQRYQKYLAVNQTQDTGQDDSPSTFDSKEAIDPGVTRPRTLVIVSELTVNSHDFLQIRADYEKNIRYGRSQVLTLIVSSWRDAANKLWQINAFVDINIPSLALSTRRWLISDVTLIRDINVGTQAHLTLYQPEAFGVLEPELQPFDRDRQYLLDHPPGTTTAADGTPIGDTAGHIWQDTVQ